MNAPTIFDTALNYYIISLIRVQHTKIMMPTPFVLDLKKKNIVLGVVKYLLLLTAAVA